MPEPGRATRAGVAPVAMVAAVVVAGVIPFLRFRQFYLSGDSIAQWLPVSRRIGDLLLAGESHLMDPASWRGGNFVAEARFGVWNPVALLLDVTVLQLDDLATAAMAANLAYLLILAVGVYLLAVEYGAAPWPAAVAGLVTGPVRVERSVTDRAHRELVEFERTGDGDAVMTFARLAWPGYTATVDGRPLTVGGGPAGLLTVTIPGDVDGGVVVVEWVPPFWRPLLAVLALAVLLAVATEVAWRRRASAQDPDEVVPVGSRTPGV